MGQQLDAFIPGPIHSGIASVDFSRSIGFSSSFVVSSTQVVSSIAAYSEGSGEWTLGILISLDNGANYTLAQSLAVPAGTTYVVDFAGLVVDKYALIKLKYYKGFGSVANPVVNILLESLN